MAYYGSQYGYEAPVWYGSGNDGEKGPFINSRRQRMNMVPILVCLLIPWCLFVAVFATVSFRVNYEKPILCWFVLSMALLVVVVVGARTYMERFRIGHNAPTERAPSWYVFMFFSLVLALVVGVSLGYLNYNSNMKPYYDNLSLGTYLDINPSRVRGQQIMDAGAVVFTQGAHLDIKHSQGFNSGGMYCVAPITYGKDALATYDFWAVGKDCCSGTTSNFHCGGFSDATMPGGLRLMRDDERPFYKLAVQQAEATYNIKAVHPLFFHWVHDVPGTVASWSDSGWQLFIEGTCTYFIVQAFFVGVASIAFSKLGRY
jgi:phosphatidylglycerophosphate synthase